MQKTAAFKWLWVIDKVIQFPGNDVEIFDAALQSRESSYFSIFEKVIVLRITNYMFL